MTAHRYWRLYVNSNNGDAQYVGLDGLEMSLTAGGANIALSGNGTGSGSSTGQEIYLPSYAFDANGSTHWVATTGSTSNEWLKWDFGAANEQDIGEFRIVQSAWIALNATVGTADIQYSDNDSSWTTSISIVNPATAGTMSYAAQPGSVVVSVTAPVPTLNATAFGTTLATANLTAPKPTLLSHLGGSSALQAARPELTFIARNSYGDNAVFVIAPAASLSAYGGGRAALAAPTPTLSVTATGTALASAALTAPVPTLSATGTVSETTYAALVAPTPNLIGYGGAVCSVTIGAATLVSTGTGGGVASAQITVPLAQLSAAVTAQNHGSAILTAPAGKMAGTLQAYIVAPGATLTAIGSATITATYEAYALNLNHTPVPGQQQQPTDEMTRYTDFPFTHIVRYQNSYFGVAAGGLYLLEGTTDDGAEINYAVQTAKTDFGTPEKKTIAYAYFGGRMGAEATITLVVGESGTETYSYTTPRGEAAQNYRQAFGRGVKSRYYAIKVEGGAALELDTLDLNVDQLTRRI